MTLDDLLAAHARGLLVDPQHAGEVLARNRGDTSLAVRATVDRVGRERDQETGRLLPWRAVLFVPRHQVHGILDVAPGDTWTLQMVKGDQRSQVDCRLVRVRSEDAGAFTLEVER